MKRKDEGEDKETGYAKHRRSGVSARFTDLLPPSLFLWANLFHLTSPGWPAHLASFNQLKAGNKSAAHSSHL